MKNIVCSVLSEKINERVVRINALLVILITCTGFILNSSLLLLFLTFDFFIRGFTTLKISPVSITSLGLVKTLQMKEKTIGKAPKIFAARLGFLMMIIISVLYLLNFKIAALSFSGMLVLFAFLEFSLGICIGCSIYSYVVIPFFKKNSGSLNYRQVINRDGSSPGLLVE